MFIKHNKLLNNYQILNTIRHCKTKSKVLQKNMATSNCICLKSINTYYEINILNIKFIYSIYYFIVMM